MFKIILHSFRGQAGFETSFLINEYRIQVLKDFRLFGVNR